MNLFKVFRKWDFGQWNLRKSYSESELILPTYPRMKTKSLRGTLHHLAFFSRSCFSASRNPSRFWTIVSWFWSFWDPFWNEIWPVLKGKSSMLEYDWRGVCYSKSLLAAAALQIWLCLLIFKNSSYSQIILKLSDGHFGLDSQ